MSDLTLFSREGIPSLNDGLNFSTVSREGYRRPRRGKETGHRPSNPVIPETKIGRVRENTGSTSVKETEMSPYLTTPGPGS